MPTPVLELEQKVFLKGTRTFTVFDDDIIRAMYNEGWCTYDCRRSLVDFDPEPSVHFYFDTPMLIVAILTGIVSIVLLVLGLNVNQQHGVHLVCYTIAELLGSCSILCFIGLRRKNLRALVFAEESGNRTFEHIVLFWQKPSASKFDKFVKFLKERIIEAKTKSAKSRGIDISQQLDKLIRMKEEGHLTLYEFEKAKARIINEDKVR